MRLSADDAGVYGATTTAHELKLVVPDRRAGGGV
jgi:hypothetical protein